MFMILTIINHFFNQIIKIDLNIHLLCYLYIMLFIYHIIINFVLLSNIKMTNI